MAHVPSLIEQEGRTRERTRGNRKTQKKKVDTKITKATDGKKNRAEKKKSYLEEELPAHSETEMNITDRQINSRPQLGNKLTDAVWRQ